MKRCTTGSADLVIYSAAFFLRRNSLEVLRIVAKGLRLGCLQGMCRYLEHDRAVPYKRQGGDMREWSGTCITGVESREEWQSPPLV